MSSASDSPFPSSPESSNGTGIETPLTDVTDDMEAKVKHVGSSFAGTDSLKGKVEGYLQETLEATGSRKRDKTAAIEVWEALLTELLRLIRKRDEIFYDLEDLKPEVEGAIPLKEKHEEATAMETRSGTTVLEYEPLEGQVKKLDELKRELSDYRQKVEELLLEYDAANTTAWLEAQTSASREMREEKRQLGIKRARRKATRKANRKADRRDDRNANKKMTEKRKRNHLLNVLQDYNS